jgi:hypothetical protein
LGGSGCGAIIVATLLRDAGQRASAIALSALGNCIKIHVLMVLTYNIKHRWFSGKIYLSIYCISTVEVILGIDHIAPERRLKLSQIHAQNCASSDVSAVHYELNQVQINLG